jgi:adhesin transport system membrane fusion protein
VRLFGRRREPDPGTPLARAAGPSRADLMRARGFAPYMSDARAAVLDDATPMAGLSLALLLAVLAAGALWAHTAVLDEVTVAHGHVVPSSREQVVQSLEGGILAALEVREGDVVAAGDVLLRIDDTRFSASFNEGEARARSLRAKVARLRSEAGGTAPVFPEDIPPELAELERNLYRSRRDALEQAVGAISRSHQFAREELEMTAPLVRDGVVSEVEVLRLRRQVNELAAQMRDRRNSFRAEARAELAEAEAELAQLAQVNAARADQVDRTVVRAPVRGTVKNIRMTTLGGVIQPGQAIMEIVPLEDRLLVEARVPPKDVAFLRPGLEATVKITAYDYSIYGGLEGRLEHISADTIIEGAESEPFYRIRVGTRDTHLAGPAGPLPIIPGMTATVEVLTGHKSARAVSARRAATGRRHGGAGGKRSHRKCEPGHAWGSGPAAILTMGH